MQTRLIDIADMYLVVMGEKVLPHSMRCRLELAIPPRAHHPHPRKCDLSGVVQEIVFAQGGIRLVFKLESVPDEVSRLIDDCGLRKPRSAYVTV